MDKLLVKKKNKNKDTLLKQGVFYKKLFILVAFIFFIYFDSFAQEIKKEQFISGILVEISAPSFLIVMLNNLSGMEKQLITNSFKRGLFTGNITFFKGFEDKLSGIRGELTAGYFRYWTSREESPFYTILITGIEPYIHYKGSYLGVGVGNFISYLEKGIIYSLPESVWKMGYTYWLSIGSRHNEIMQYNIKLRFHIFQEKNPEADIVLLFGILFYL